MVSQHHSILLIWASVAVDVNSFSIAFTSSVVRSKTTKTALFAGFAGVDSYLGTLSNFDEIPRQAGSATDLYLNSLSQFVETTQGSSAEDYLTSISQFAGAAIAASPSADHAMDSGTLLLSDARSVEQTIASSVSLASDSLTTQLSDLSYETLKGNKLASIPVPQASLSDVSSGLSEKLAFVGDAAKKVLEEGAASLQGFGGTYAAEKIKLVENDVQRLADEPIFDLANSVVTSLKTLGSSFFQVIDLVLQDLGGTNIAEVIARAQLSASGMVTGAVQSVAATMDQIGTMSVAQAVQNLVALIVAVTKILFTILNAVAKVLSGKGINDLAIAAGESVEREASNVIAQANAAVLDGSSKSLNEVGSLIGDFSQNVGKLMVTSVDAAISGSQYVASDPSISSSVESVSTAVSKLL